MSIRRTNILWKETVISFTSNTTVISFTSNTDIYFEFWYLLFENMMSSIVEGNNLFIFSLTMNLAVENFLSGVELVAGIHKYRSNNLYKVGNFSLFLNHHCATSKFSSSAIGWFKYLSISWSLMASVSS